MSTILDALRKLQRERAAENPSRDLRGSLTSETPHGRARRRGGSSLWVILGLLLISVGGGGYWLYRSGQIDALRLRFAGAPSVDAEEAARLAQIAELEEMERQMAAQEAATPTEPEVGADAEPAPQVAAPPAAEAPPAPTPAPAPAPRVDTPETLAERARLEAALANARAAQEKQRQAELAAASAASAAAAPPAAKPGAEAPAAKPIEKKPEVVAKAPAATPKPKPPAAKPPAARTATAAKTAPAPAARVEPESTSAQSAFPAVRVESIRWHPIPERRVASLHFERQNVPQAHEGDIVAGVLVYRIDPGAVELRIGTAHRVVSPAP